MKNEIFQPFKQHLDHDKTQELLRKILRSADDGEIFFEEKRSESLVLDDQTLKSANLDASKGFGVRAEKKARPLPMLTPQTSAKSLYYAQQKP